MDPVVSTFSASIHCASLRPTPTTTVPLYQGSPTRGRWNRVSKLHSYRLAHSDSDLPLLITVNIIMMIWSRRSRCSIKTRVGAVRIQDRLSEWVVFLLLFCVATSVQVRAQDVQSMQEIDESVSDDGEVSTMGEQEDSITAPKEVVEDSEKEEEEEGSIMGSIMVEDYLETLDVAALEAICIDRGFDIIPRKDGLPLERSDYLAAARRCLSLEDEMNAILAKNPELAAELEAEIDRMRQHKERLERERERLLYEKAQLEEQLEKAGVDLMEANQRIDGEKGNLDDTIVVKKSPENMTAKELLIESSSQLYDRVLQDLKLGWKIAGPFVRPVIGAIQLIWRYCRPLIHKLWKEVSKRAKQIFVTARNAIEQKIKLKKAADN